MQQQAHRGFVSWDGLGASVSFACAVHCAALPIVFGMLPGVQMALRSVNHDWHGLAQFLLWTHEAERLVVSVVVLFAALVLGAGFRRHGRRHVVAVGLGAATLMLLGAFGHWHGEDAWHVVLQVAGGFGIAAAHVLNLRALHAMDPGHERHSHGWRALIGSA